MFVSCGFRRCVWLWLRLALAVVVMASGKLSCGMEKR
jgi:hypothetical protein